jgi:hypothetical protein
VNSPAFLVTFVVEHPAFGEVRFAFDDRQANSGFAATDGFVFFGVEYPKFTFGFQREGSAFISCKLNSRTSQMFNDRLLTISEVAPRAYSSFVLSKAKELAANFKRDGTTKRNMKTGRDVICRARDLGAVKAYYGAELGMPVVLDTDSMVGFDTGELTLYYERGEAGPPVFEFFVDDVRAAKSRLIGAGCEIVEENPAVPRVYLRDRFGLIFNITEG